MARHCFLSLHLQLPTGLVCSIRKGQRSLLAEGVSLWHIPLCSKSDK